MIESACRICCSSVRGWDAISSCSALDPAFGYQTARVLLEERFGYPYKIATAQHNRAVRGPPLQAVRPAWFADL